MTADVVTLVRRHELCRPYDLRAGDIIIDPYGQHPDHTVLERWLPARDSRGNPIVVVLCDPVPQKWTMRAAQHACVPRLERT
jgi:hypothetical protein